MPIDSEEKEQGTKVNAESKPDDTRREPEEVPDAPVRPRFF